MPSSQALAVPDFTDALRATEPSVLDTRRVKSRRTERKLATVVFIDVNDSMGLTRDIAPEDWWSVSADLFGLMGEAADCFGGWLGTFTGDGANAVFEASGERNHHARRACHAALWLRDAVSALAVELRAVYGFELSVRIGINSGEVLTGTIRHRRRRVYTANGYAVGLAKRMEALARPHRIYLTEYTAALVTDVFRLHELGAAWVKGAQSPIGVFELLGTDTSSAWGGETDSPEPIGSNDLSRGG